VFAVKGQNLLAHLEAIGRIDVAQGLIHQHDARRGRHGATQATRACRWPPDNSEGLR
jgi:hypothetical protein